MSAEQPKPDSLRAKLQSEVMPARWPELLYQFARGALFLVAPTADLLDVAEAIATDDKQAVELLLKSAALRRATDDDARTLQAAPEMRLQFVVVQPWVVAQVLG